MSHVLMVIFFFGSSYPAASDDFPSRPICMREGEKLMTYDYRVSGFLCEGPVLAPLSSQT